MNSPDSPQETGWRWVLAAALPASLLLVALVAGQRADPDLWGRISVGAVLFRAGHLPRIDDFSYTAAGQTWVDHEWLSGVVFYGLLSETGEAGLLLFKYGAAASALGLVLAAHRWAYRASPLLGAWALTLLCLGYVSAYLSTVRAQVFSVTGFLLFLLVLERVRLGQWRPRTSWLLVPVGVAWANAHGGFVMGLLAVGLYAGAELLERRPRRAALHAGLLVATLAALAIVNPYGLDYLSFLLHAWTLDRSGVAEWEPLLAGPLGPGSIYLASITLLAAALASRMAWMIFARGGAWPVPDSGRPAPQPRPGLGPALVLLLVVCMALLARRIHSFTALTLAFYLPLLLTSAETSPWLAGRSRLNRLLGVWAPLAACLAAPVVLAVALPARPMLRTFVPDEKSRGVDDRFRYPVGAVRWLRQSPYQGRLLNPFTQGEFLYWALYPRLRVAMDGRYEEVYRQEQYRWVRLFYGAGDSERTVALAGQSGADFILSRSRWPGLAALGRSPEWRRIYDDGHYALVGRVHTLDRHLPFRAMKPGATEPPTIASFFTESDRERFADYPRPGSPSELPGTRGSAGAGAPRQRAARPAAAGPPRAAP